MSIWATLFRALRLRCPGCGRTRLFLPWSFRMPNACTECDRSLQGEAGFYLGAIYVNYGITSIVILVTYVVAAQVWDVPAKTRLTICAAIAVLLPLLMFRHARSLWLAMDAYFDPSSQL